MYNPQLYHVEWIYTEESECYILSITSETLPQWSSLATHRLKGSPDIYIRHIWYRQSFSEKRNNRRGFSPQCCFWQCFILERVPCCGEAPHSWEVTNSCLDIVPEPDLNIKHTVHLTSWAEKTNTTISHTNSIVILKVYSNMLIRISKIDYRGQSYTNLNTLQL